VVKLFNYVIGCAMMILVCWKGFEKAVESMETGDSPMNLPVQIYPFVFFLAFGCGILCLEFFRDILRSIVKLKKESDL
jgi:TRAP-type mannitol/chloroaromatic compound transport system permease small subunit